MHQHEGWCSIQLLYEKNTELCCVGVSNTASVRSVWIGVSGSCRGVLSWRCLPRHTGQGAPLISCNQALAAQGVQSSLARSQSGCHSVSASLTARPVKAGAGPDDK
jgi:hypothetical protein